MCDSKDALMEIEERNRLNRSIRRLEEGEAEPAEEAEVLLLEVLRPLLAADGYDVAEHTFEAYPDLDYLAKRKSADERMPSALAIDFKYYPRYTNISVHAVESFLRSRSIQGVDRLLLISNVSHTADDVHEAEYQNPLGVQLMDMNDLRAWVARQTLETSLDGLSIMGMLRALSRAFARRIAADPSALDQIEWRDLERLLAEVFDGLGFAVELTPASKDGGKDLILECSVRGSHRSFIIEVKHWRSGQRVGPGAVRKFLKVVIRERRAGGLFLSTYGYADTAFEALSQVDQKRLRFGDREKILGLCTTYLRMESGLWTASQPLPELLFEATRGGC